MSTAPTPTSAHPGAEPIPGPHRGLLFTAFEPSGDDHASAVIAALRQNDPTLPIYAWGGPKMQAAGATIIEFTGESAVMGLPGAQKIIEHQRINKRIARWLDGDGKDLAAVHVPVDSPAANFPICRIAKARGLKVVHLVAPQVWAWASWRIRKLRRLTDLVLCLLPFEESWFLARGVPARFIGHPLFDHPIDAAELDARASAFPGAHGQPKLALMPGSRPSEMQNCFPILLDAYRRLKKDFPQTTAIVAATKPQTADRLREIAEQVGGGGDGAPGGLPPDVSIVSGDTDGVVRWCDYALVVSGTVTLQIAKQHRPMVALYRPNKFIYQLLGRWLVSTELFTLPNLVAGQAVVPEFIPHFGDGEELALEVIKFMRRSNYADDQRAALKAICARFEQAREAFGGAGPAAATAIAEVLASTGVK